MTDEVRALQDRFWAEAERLMWAHCAPWELDEALTEAGFEIGPCEAQDLVGLETVLGRRRAMGAPDTILDRMVAEGRVGKLGGWGYYRYPGGGGAVIDPLLEDLIDEEAHFHRAVRTNITDAEIVARMTAVLQGVPADVARAAVGAPVIGAQ
ncbi:MAG: 3-hydroxyacyl-CoA dehydrogenase family protein [Pseudomonadota bacterium]